MCNSQFARTFFLFAIASASAVALEVYSSTASAAACSGADQQIRSQYHEASLKALMEGDLNRYRSLQQSLPGKLSSACGSILDRLEPMRVKCTAEEKDIVLEHYQAVMQAAWSGDISRMFALLEHLEQALSPQCWLATNRQTDPRVQSACTAAELDHVASFAGPVLRASSHLLSTGDLGPFLQVAQAAAAPLSQECNYAFARLQQQAQQSPNPAKQYQPGNVIDHGGGTYSVPGIGACTPSGCMAY